jgi:hypothetical protein
MRLAAPRREARALFPALPSAARLTVQIINSGIVPVLAWWVRSKPAGAPDSAFDSSIVFAVQQPATGPLSSFQTHPLPAFRKARFLALAN